MAKILATEIRAGQLLEWEKKIFRVLKAHHVHVGGRGGAFMQVEMKDIDIGTKRNERIRSDDKVERPFIESLKMTFSYQDGNDFIFMDNETFEQITVNSEFLEGQTGYLLPGCPVQINVYQERPIAIELPTSVILTVTETEPSIKNATATTTFKPAIMETGLIVQVPPFVTSGEKIKINTTEGTYMERAN